MNRLLTYPLVLCGFAMLLIGCDGIPPRPPLGKQVRESTTSQNPAVELKPKQSAAVSSVPQKSADFAPTPGHQPKQIESWYRYEMQGARVGSMHTIICPVDDPETGLFQVTINDRIRIRRGKDVSEQWIEQTSVETAKGSLVSFDAVVHSGSDLTVFSGKVALDRLTVTTTPAGKSPQIRHLPWMQGYASFLATQQSLREKPMVKDEIRQLRVLLPIQYLIGVVELNATCFAQVPVENGEVKRLLEIEESFSLNGTTFQRTVSWMDEAGEILKTYYPSVDMLAYLTDEANATETSDTPPPDLLSLSRIALNKPVPMNARTAVYHLTHSNPEFKVPQNHRQHVERLESGKLQVTVTANPESEDDEGQPQPADSAASPKIELDDVEIQRLANEAISSDNEPIKLATELRDIVDEHISTKDFSQAFASAAETAKNRTGDCTEHAVLLAALCRVRKIPARVAAGLVQITDADGPAMNFHAWTLIWDGEHWRAVDAMFGKRPIGAERIELLSTDLADGNPYAVLAPVMEVVGQLKVELQ